MELIVWRHPRPQDVAGRCIGQVDVAVDRRKIKRLAHRVREHARRHRLFEPRQRPTVWTSPLARCHAVGGVLRRWGWVHRVDVRLSELDFGHWDGKPWAAIAVAEIDTWCRDFSHERPGGGESVFQLLARCRAFVDEQQARVTCCLVVGHAGWINALRWLDKPLDELPAAADWPVPPGYSMRVEFDRDAAGTTKGLAASAAQYR